MKLCCQHLKINKKKTVKRRKKIYQMIQLVMKDQMNTEVQNVKVKEQLEKTIKILKKKIGNFG